MEQATLNLIPTGIKPICHASQYDVGRVIRFNLTNNGVPYTLDGTESISVKIKKHDGTSVEHSVTNTSSTYIDYTTVDGDCDVAGDSECELVISKSGVVIGSRNFVMKVEADPYDGEGVVTETAGPAPIATFETNIIDTLQEVKCSINPIQNGTPWIDSNVINKVPYIKRAVAGTASRIGNHLYDKLVGGTVAWNQLVQNGNFADASDWMPYNANNISISVANNILTATALNAGGGYNFGVRQYSSTTFKDHIYFVLIDCKPEIAGEYGIDFDGSYKGNSWQLSANEWNKIRLLTKANGSNNPSIVLEPQAQNIQTVGSTIQWKNVNIIDLTQMFGSTIADYIYRLEQSTAGAGVAWFRALFPNDYYAYNAGESMSVKATAHIMRDASNTVIGNYPLDSNLELRGFPMLVNNKLEYDGDEYTSVGYVLRKYTEYIFTGSEHWGFYSSEPAFWHCSSLTISGITGIQNICSNGVPVTVSNGTQIRVYLRNNPQISGTSNLNDIFSNGTKIVYAVASPTTETAQPFTNPQVCDENGTEEYTDNRAVAIPVGHETYQANICEITGLDELNIKQSGQDTSEIAKLIKLEFDDTVFLAEVSCLNGVWKLKLLGAEVNLGDLSWYPGACALENKYTMRSDGIANVVLAPPSSSIIVDILCSIYPTNSGDTTFLGNTGISIMRGGTLAVFDDRYSTIDSANAFKSAMTGVKLVYPLATPTEITLDETEQFESLIGVNNVWHDGNGDTEVKYLYNA